MSATRNADFTMFAYIGSTKAVPTPSLSFHKRNECAALNSVAFCSALVSPAIKSSGRPGLATKQDAFAIVRPLLLVNNLSPQWPYSKNAALDATGVFV